MKPTATMLTFMTASCVLLTSISHLRAEDWPCWRGPAHIGVTNEPFKTDWTQPPKVLWEQPIGSAFSAFACVKDKVYTCGEKDKKQVLFCFDAQSGKPIWELPFAAQYKDSQGGDGTRATPTVDDGMVYIVGGGGVLLCADAAGGKVVWQKQMTQKPQWGYAGSVLIEGDLAIVEAGGDDGTVMAVNKKTGTPEWKCGNEAPGYSTPFPFMFEGQRYLSCMAAKAVLLVDPKTGKQVGRIPWETSYDVNASEPNYQDGYLFLTTGYSTGCALFKLSKEGDRLKASEVWRNKVLLTKFTSCVLKDGKLYGGDQKGMRCVDFMTGKELWSEKYPNAWVLLDGEYLIVQTEGGKVLLAKASPESFKPIGSVEPMKGRSWTVPTLANGRLYVRNLKKAVCLDLAVAGK